MASSISLAQEIIGLFFDESHLVVVGHDLLCHSFLRALGRVLLLDQTNRSLDGAGVGCGGRIRGWKPEISGQRRMVNLLADHKLSETMLNLRISFALARE